MTASGHVRPAARQRWRAAGLPPGERLDVTAPDGRRVAVEAYGPQDAPQVVLAHGWTNSGHVWDEVVALVADRLRMVTYDQPGHARSEPPVGRAYDLDVHGAALRAVIDGATVPGRLVLVGHSLGGMTVLNLARRHPEVVRDRVRGALLLSTMSRVPVRVGRLARLIDLLSDASRWTLDHGGRDVVGLLRSSRGWAAERVTRAVAFGPGASPEAVAAMTALVDEVDPDVFAGLSPSILTLDEETALQQLRVPTTVVVGDADRLTLPAYAWHLARVLHDARLLILPGVGHMTPLEAPELVAAELLRLHDVAAG